MTESERKGKLARVKALIGMLPSCWVCASTRKARAEGAFGIPVVRDCPNCVRSIMPQIDAIWAEPWTEAAKDVVQK